MSTAPESVPLTLTAAIGRMLALAAPAPVLSRQCLATCVMCRNHLLYLLDGAAPLSPEQYGRQVTARLRALPEVHRLHQPGCPDENPPVIRGIADDNREGDCPHPEAARRDRVLCTACGEDLYRGCGSVEGMAGELTRRGILAAGESWPRTRTDLAWLLDSTSPAAVAMQRWARDTAAGTASVIPPGPLQAEGTWPNPVQEGPSGGS